MEQAVITEIHLVPVKLFVVKPDQGPSELVVWIYVLLRSGQVDTQGPPAGSPVADGNEVPEAALRQLTEIPNFL